MDISNKSDQYNSVLFMKNQNQNFNLRHRKRESWPRPFTERCGCLKSRLAEENLWAYSGQGRSKTQIVSNVALQKNLFMKHKKILIARRLYCRL
jgi:hypothetical protein